ncbi:MAG: fucose isomerase [Deltaproteobacteria bacterium]|nr:fucose isomerase [Deltaproteobacteria bacterium]
MSKRVALFWPGDGRPIPNELARPSVEAATVQLERALGRLGRESYRVEGFIAKPHEAIAKIRPIDDPLVAVCVHWIYGPHTTEGVVGKDNPLLLASNFSGQWPGLVGLLNTGACLEMLGRPFSRAWTDSADFCADEIFMSRLGEWCTTGRIGYPENALAYHAPISPAAAATARSVAAGLRARRPLLLMLGDTSMGMLNGYFGPLLLARHGFAEHKIDQAWLIERGRGIASARIEDAFRFVRDRGVEFHWREPGSEDFDETATREQLRDYLAVLDLVREYGADLVGWQYQLGLTLLRPPSDFAEGLLNSACRPESNGDTIVCATEADQGNALPMELLKRLLAAKGLHQAVMFHDVRWGAEHEGRFLWVLLNSGSCSAYAFNHDPGTLRGVHSYRQPALYFPHPGGTFAGESLPGPITWARAFVRAGELWMDVGRGEAVKLPVAVREAWWRGTTRQWPFMAAWLGVSRDSLMAHYLSNHVAVAYGDVCRSVLLYVRTRAEDASPSLRDGVGVPTRPSGASPLPRDRGRLGEPSLLAPQCVNAYESACARCVDGVGFCCSRFVTDPRHDALALPSSPRGTTARSAVRTTHRVLRGILRRARPPFGRTRLLRMAGRERN